MTESLHSPDSGGRYDGKKKAMEGFHGFSAEVAGIGIDGI